MKVPKLRGSRENLRGGVEIGPFVSELRIRGESTGAVKS
jgi:hypothetical protein